MERRSLLPITTVARLMNTVVHLAIVNLPSFVIDGLIAIYLRTTTP